jgi:hypothetical protein
MAFSDAGFKAPVGVTVSLITTECHFVKLIISTTTASCPDAVELYGLWQSVKYITSTYSDISSFCILTDSQIVYIKFYNLLNGIFPNCTYDTRKYWTDLQRLCRDKDVIIRKVHAHKSTLSPHKCCDMIATKILKLCM